MYLYLVIITGVSYKKYHKKYGKRAKRHYVLYGYDQNGNFIRKRISRFEAFFRKFQKKKRFRFICDQCGRTYQINPMISSLDMESELAVLGVILAAVTVPITTIAILKTFNSNAE